MMTEKSFSTIKAFSGQFGFLSNFYPSSIIYDGISYPTIEHFYQAQKTRDVATRKVISEMATPADAKRFGKALYLREDWEEVKIDVMKEGLALKFQDTDLRRKLLETGEALLLEGNMWGDDFWGYDLRKREGKNVLGTLLMELRDNLRHQRQQVA